MEKYHKIQTAYLRDPDTNYKTLLEGQWSKSEFELLKDIIWRWDEKIDGTNIRVRYNAPYEEDPQTGGIIPLEFRAKKDNNALIQPSLLARLPEIFSLDQMRDIFGSASVCMYGEGFGNHIQKAGKFYLPKGVGFILFDIKIKRYWLERNDLEKLAVRFGIPIVPIIGYGTLEEAIELTRTGFMSEISEKFQTAEGLIMRPKIGLCSRSGNRIITKIKYKDFKHV